MNLKIELHYPFIGNKSIFYLQITTALTSFDYTEKDGKRGLSSASTPYSINKKTELSNRRNQLIFLGVFLLLKVKCSKQNACKPNLIILFDGFYFIEYAVVVVLCCVVLYV